MKTNLSNDQIISKGLVMEATATNFKKVSKMLMARKAAKVDKVSKA